ncbi:MAG: histidinol-phosphatase [Deltaproteobacteria bacterium]|nr:MAG: histidinol-phosphatase [Deltaproteobacteria bacterium]
MLSVYSSDLHIHTCLSPCADLEMTPAKIVRKAVEAKLDIIAITDHNSGKNVGAVMKAASDFPLAVIPGMEVQSREEVHLLSLFRSLESLEEWDAFVYDHLPDVCNDPDVFGHQPLVDEEGYVLCFEEKLLINSIDLSLEEVIYGVRDLGGICIPSHVDKEAFSIISQLGYIPRGLPIDAVEVSSASKREDELGGYEVITSSDAHFLRDIGTKKTLFSLEAPSLEEIQRALQGEGGRRIIELL